MFVSSVLEKSCVVRHSSLTLKNIRDLERVQKVSVKIITNGKFTYKEALKELKLETLKQRREMLTTRFAKTCLKNSKTKIMFPRKTKVHPMRLRYTKKYQEKKLIQIEYTNQQSHT